jgi:hypothetical protein
MSSPFFSFCHVKLGLDTNIRYIGIRRECQYSSRFYTTNANTNRKPFIRKLFVIISLQEVSLLIYISLNSISFLMTSAFKECLRKPNRSLPLLNNSPRPLLRPKLPSNLSLLQPCVEMHLHEIFTMTTASPSS